MVNTGDNPTLTAPTTTPTTLVYLGINYIFQRNVGISLSPTVTGTVTACSASPTLPAGLSINNTTCAISGTPTANQGSISYTITASNASGNTVTTIFISVQSSVKRIFVTSSAYNGDLRTAGGGGDGAAGADSLCNADANKPNASSYKAILVDTTNRLAGTTTNCTLVAENMNWVLGANMDYVRSSDNAKLFTSNSAGIFVFGTLTNSFDPGTQKQYWTGFRGVPFEWRSGISRCNDWTSGISAFTGRFGFSDAIDYNSISTGTQNNCDISKYLLSAEQ